LTNIYFLLFRNSSGKKPDPRRDPRPGSPGKIHGMQNRLKSQDIICEKILFLNENAGAARRRTGAPPQPAP
jgi:hypothetical protein